MAAGLRRSLLHFFKNAVEKLEEDVLDRFLVMGNTWEHLYFTIHFQRDPQIVHIPGVGVVLFIGGHHIRGGA